MCCSSNLVHALPVPALSHAYTCAGAAKAVGWWLAATARTRYKRRSIFRSAAVVVAMAVAVAIAMAMAVAVAVAVTAKVSSC